MFCKNCGQEIAEGTAFCPNCNAPVDAAATAPVDAPVQPQQPPVNAQPVNNAQPPYGVAPQQPYAQPPYAPYSAPAPSQEPASLGLRFVCWFIPIVGIILYFVKKDEKPVYAKQCGKAALISIIVNFVLGFVLSFVTTLIGVGMYY